MKKPYVLEVRLIDFAVDVINVMEMLAKSKTEEGNQETGS